MERFIVATGACPTRLVAHETDVRDFIRRLSSPPPFYARAVAGAQLFGMVIDTATEPGRWRVE